MISSILQQALSGHIHCLQIPPWLYFLIQVLRNSFDVKLNQMGSRMAPQLFPNGIVNFDRSILFTDPMITDACDIPLGKEEGG